ncbi:hypothetical protein HKD37_09G026301 [Glycine soja]
MEICQSLGWVFGPRLGGYILKEKLKRLKQHLKAWNKDQFDDVQQKFSTIEKKLNELEVKGENSPLSGEEVQLRRKLQGACIEEPKRVKEAVRQFFRTRFQASPELRPLLDGVDFKTIDQSDNVMLIAPFEEAEVRQLCGNVEAPRVQVQMGSISNSSRNSGRIPDVRHDHTNVVGVSTVLPQTPKEHFLQHSYCCMEGVIQNRWQTLWVALTWRIWHYRNRLVFSNEEFDGQKVLEEVNANMSSTGSGGIIIKFWEDTWINDDISLVAKYPRLYSISNQQNHVIQQLGAQSDSGWEWDFRWRRSLFDSEVTMADSFLNDIEGKTVHPCRRDEWVWKAEPSGIYSTKSAYNLLQGEIIEASADGVFAELWKLKVPKKVSVFAWRLIRDRLPTKTNLRRRQWESLSWVDTITALPENPKMHFLQHTLGKPAGIGATRWRCWWLALTWTIWKQRNNLLFSNGTLNANKLLDDALFLLWSWLKNFEPHFTANAFDVN